MKTLLAFVVAVLSFSFTVSQAGAERICDAKACVRQRLISDLSQNPQVPLESIFIDIIEGRAFFHGVVSTEAQKELITEIAMENPRIFSVKNLIQVKSEK